MPPNPMSRAAALAASCLLCATLAACETTPATTAPGATPTPRPLSAPTAGAIRAQDGNASTAVPTLRPRASAASASPAAGTTTAARPAATAARTAAPASTAVASGAASGASSGASAARLPSPTVTIPNRAPAPSTAATPAPASAPRAPAPGGTPAGARPATTTAATPRPAPAGTPTEAERRQLAALPLPHLPTLVAREPVPEAGDAAGDTADVAPEAGLAPAAAGAPAAVAASGSEADAARAALALAHDRTGLDEPQLARIREFERQIERGDTAGALTGLDRLNRELDAAVATVTVGRGETLSVIAEKPEIYSNAYLWPLLWDANKPQLAQPWQVRPGQQLRVPKYPRLADVATAIDYAHAHSPDGRRPPADAKPAADSTTGTAPAP